VSLLVKEFWGGLLSSEPNDEGCDTTGDDSSTGDDKIMI